MKVKVKITKDGNLQVERAGKLKAQGCPYKDGDVPCGDWCALFTEVEGCIELCESTICYGSIEDERK